MCAPCRDSVRWMWGAVWAVTRPVWLVWGIGRWLWTGRSRPSPRSGTATAASSLALRLIVWTSRTTRPCSAPWRPARSRDDRRNQAEPDSDCTQEPGAGCNTDGRPRTSGDLPLAAHVAASSSHLALQTGDAARAADWARTGLDLAAQGPRIPALTARLNTMQARALAAAAQHTPATRALDAARRDLEGAATADHPWLSPFDAAALASESALTLRDLEHYDQALTHAEQAVALRETVRARSLALSRITLVDIHLRRRDLDAAVSAGHDLLSTSPTLGSIRVVQQLDELRRLLEPHRSYGPVREYLVRFDDARRARMLLLADLIPPSGGTTA